MPHSEIGSCWQCSKILVVRFRSASSRASPNPKGRERAGPGSRRSGECLWKSCSHLYCRSICSLKRETKASFVIEMNFEDRFCVLPTSERFVVKLKATALVIHRSDGTHPNHQLFFRLLIVSGDLNAKQKRRSLDSL